MKIDIETKGNNDVIDLTEKIIEAVKISKIEEGLCLVFCPGSTVGITSIEAEPNLIKDLKEFLEKLVPAEKSYYHDKTWGEKNGFSHLRSSLIKPFFIIPIEQNNLLLGTWQKIVLIDFDNRPRQREIFIKIYQ